MPLGGGGGGANPTDGPGRGSFRQGEPQPDAFIAGYRRGGGGGQEQAVKSVNLLID